MTQGFKAFLGISALALIAALLAVLSFDKSSIHYTLNQFHHPIADGIFKNITHIGGVSSAFIALVVLFFVNRNTMIELIIALIFSVGVTASIKFVIAPNSIRPVYALENLRTVPGVTNTEKNSFPSGHTTFIFCIATTLASRVRKPYWGIAMGTLAIAVAFSRIYLSQHYVIDVLVGGIIGISGGLLGHYLIYVKPPKRLAKWTNT